MGAPRVARASAYFQNGAAVRAAGLAPIHKDDPGYGTHLDRDGEGVGCGWHQRLGGRTGSRKRRAAVCGTWAWRRARPTPANPAFA
ncbi:excalibur calcium-binding domain-containing protein [Kitasatospora indigofera]|uniref:excalibur calcium-binding domain-containing protein n=1 Tax=Kitasatospora indigofera TaxID=67307 RepID=UPI0036B8E66E